MDRKIYCPKKHRNLQGKKWLFIVQENVEEGNSENLRTKVPIKVWCKECRKEVTIEI